MRAYQWMTKRQAEQTARRLERDGWSGVAVGYTHGPGWYVTGWQPQPDPWAPQHRVVRNVAAYRSETVV